MQANFGESLKVVGSSDALGGWDVSKSPSMTWTDGDVWCLELEIPAEEEQIHFKARRHGWVQSACRCSLPQSSTACR